MGEIHAYCNYIRMDNEGVGISCILPSAGLSLCAMNYLLCSNLFIEIVV